MMKCVLTVLLLISISVACPTVSYSNDSVVAEYGKTVIPIETDAIRMVSEEVIITRDSWADNGMATFSLGRARVKCTFLFQNTSDELIETTVGFPGFEQNDITGAIDLTDFVTTIDGKSFDIEPRVEDLGEYPGGGPGRYRNWYTWKMVFPPQSTVTVENTYTHVLSSSPGYDTFYLKYILSTGANWQGRIGKAVIKVVYENADDLESRVCSIEPAGWTRKENEIVWELEDIEPTDADNIGISERGYRLSPDMELCPLLF